jgi:hypothetical protein
MSDRIWEDLTEMKKKLSQYVDKGLIVGYHEVKREPVIAVKPDRSKIKPLKKMNNYDGHFLAVDCSTRTLKRANNWGVYLMRSAYACVKGRNVDWGYEERLCTTVGDARARGDFLEDFRVELESQMALSLLSGKVKTFYHGNTYSRGDYLLLDGAGYFGGGKKFRVTLFEECEHKEITLLTIPKRSPTLHDEKGRDLIATTGMLSHHQIWVYPCILRANKDENLYGDASLVKLCGDSPRIFRCDIMEYLTDRKVDELLSPLTSISEDPRCLGYPVTLWLAHDFSAPSDSKLLHFSDQVEEMLANEGLLDVLRVEEFSCNFPDELHGVKYPFRWEWIEHV